MAIETKIDKKDGEEEKPESSDEEQSDQEETVALEPTVVLFTSLAASNEHLTRSTPELLPASLSPSSSTSISIVIGNAPSSPGGPERTL